LTFAGLDRAALEFFYWLAQGGRTVLNPFALFLSFLGKGGVAFLLTGAILLLFRKTRRAGLSVLLAIGVGALLTNLLIKNLVARQRPYTVSEFYEMWQFVGAHVEKEVYSFPSGHATVSTASMVALFLCLNKKKFWWLLFIPIIMGASRIYLFAHYFTDVLGGYIVGTLASVAGYYLAKLVFSLLEKNKEKKAIDKILNFDLAQTLKKLKNKSE
jgi:undecaprenyl-diphosphatase